jgi:glycosyltransferase involved in cell wall biosynthesis
VDCQELLYLIAHLEGALRRTRILIDAREFILERFTGIARVLEGLIDALSADSPAKTIALAAYNPDFIPPQLRSQNGVEIEQLPKLFFRAEKHLSDLSKRTHIFISPYPKLPLFEIHSRAIHIIHDVLDLTHPFYRRRLKSAFDRYRLRRALLRGDLTWYDSSWSMTETQKHFGWCGRNPRVRHPGIRDIFQPGKQKDDNSILKTYILKSGYILALGNGMPHKNLGILLEIAQKIGRPIVFAGVSANHQRYWESRYRGINAKWISHVEEQHLPALLRGAFCLAQPSLVEGYGYPPLEAMACGRPAVVSSIPVLLETTGGNAMSADTQSPRAWAEALMALEDPSISQDRIAKGLKWVEPLRGRKAWEKYICDVGELIKNQADDRKSEA